MKFPLWKFGTEATYWDSSPIGDLLHWCLCLSDFHLFRGIVMPLSWRLFIRRAVVHQGTEAWIWRFRLATLSRLCCIGAPRAVRQRAALVSASTTRCSAAQSMASAGYKATPQSSNKDEPADETRRQKTQTNSKNRPSKNYQSGKVGGHLGCF